MAWTPPKPVETLEGLTKQFRALCSLTASFEAQLRFYQNDKREEIAARAQIEGERAANEVLTNQLEELLDENERLRQELARRKP